MLSEIRTGEICTFFRYSTNLNAHSEKYERYAWPVSSEYFLYCTVRSIKSVRKQNVISGQQWSTVLEASLYRLASIQPCDVQLCTCELVHSYHRDFSSQKSHESETATWRKKVSGGRGRGGLGGVVGSPKLGKAGSYMAAAAPL